MLQAWLVTPDAWTVAAVAAGTLAPKQIDTMMARPASRRTRVVVNFFMAVAAFLWSIYLNPSDRYVRETRLPRIIRR